MSNIPYGKGGEIDRETSKEERQAKTTPSWCPLPDAKEATE